MLIAAALNDATENIIDMSMDSRCVAYLKFEEKFSFFSH